MIAIIVGSVNGLEGNCGALLEKLSPLFPEDAYVVDLTKETFADCREELEKARGFLFITGTYWDAWGSPLQRFLEDATETETGPIWLGKPAAAVVLNHSVGGKGVLSRLMGVLNTFGVWFPPFCGVVYAKITHLLVERGVADDDIWSLGCIEVLAGNLSLAVRLGALPWVAWTVGHDTNAIWLK